MELKEKERGAQPPWLNTEQSKLCYDPTMRMFIKQFLVENANGGFNVKLLTCLYG